MKKIMQLKTKGAAFDVYEQRTKNIESPWPFPEYWVGDLAEFEVLHGGEMGGVCDVQIGKVVRVFSDKHGNLCYRMQTEKEVLDISYAAFYGNWEPGEEIKNRFKCPDCDGTGLKPEAQRCSRKIKKGGKEGYKCL